MTRDAQPKIHFDRALVLKLLSDMVLIRRFEEKCAELYTLEKIRGFLHLYIGEEANAVGVMHALAEDDAIVATYREHGHALAKGIPATEIMAEMYGKLEGSSHGRGGSMHIFDAKRRFFGGNAIVGGGLPIAVGLALADKMQGKERVTCCFFGEGAAAEGEFHESLNLAALWQLPVLFVCENNLYAMGTALARAESETSIARHAESYKIPAETVDGMSVIDVTVAAQKAVTSIRQGGGPRFLENRTYRYRAHSMFDPELYRDRSEVDEWKDRDPIKIFVKSAKGANLLHDKDVEEIEAATAEIVAEAVEFAERGTWEPEETLAEDVLAPKVEQ